MIPVITRAGLRAVAPDLVGFGRSDKHASQDDYTYQRHVDWTSSLLSALDLRNITLVCQDWGGLIGLRLAAEQGERFDRIVAANTGLPTGDQKVSEAFKVWQQAVRKMSVFDVGRVVQSGTVNKLPPEVVAAYDAPFPDESYKAGARIFPALVPTTSDDPAAPANREAWKALRRWQKPFLTAFSDSDPITGGGERVFHKLIPGAKGQSHITIEGGGHFLQEDQGEAFAQVVVDFVSQTS
jgi:haloalkane dehalogenase